jgi:adenylate cyclase, class 2
MAGGDAFPVATGSWPASTSHDWAWEPLATAHRVGSHRSVGSALARLLVRSLGVRQAPCVPAAATHEIEVKYRVHDPDGLVAALAARGIRLGQPVEQDDQAYAPEGWRYGQSKLGVSFVRLRSQDGLHLFTLKRPVDNELVCIEHESEVADRLAMHHAILAMGFRPTVRIQKIRRSGCHGHLSLCLDEVAGVGCFFEVETMSRRGDAGLAEQQAMHTFAAQLGVELERTTATYDSLVWETQLVLA